MDILNRILIRFMQAFVLVFFTFILSGYMGLVLLLPLGGFYHLISVLTEGLGFNGIFAALIAGPAVAYLLYSAYKIEGFYARILNTGIDLYKLGKTQLCAYEAMLGGGKPTSPASSGETAQAS